MENKILICSQHSEQVPLLFTFKWNFKEYWCPHCGAKYEMFDNYKAVEPTQELVDLETSNREKALPFLRNEVNEFDLFNGEKEVIK